MSVSLRRSAVHAPRVPLLPPRGQNVMSRAFQILLCVVGLLLLSPVMLLVALGVKLGSRGPVFYRGQRVGKDERVFDIFKFRTLQVDAEKQIGARLLTEGDSVYTPIGKFLKKWKLDELPQLFNVIKGDMSLVGPRPVRPIFLDQFKREIPGYARRFQVRPGATGLAQLRGGYWTEPRNKLRYEVVYIRHQSLLLDLKLMGLTFIKIFNRFVTAGVAMAALFLFASFFPAALYPWLYGTIHGVKVNLLYLAIVVFGMWMVGKKTPQQQAVSLPVADLSSDGRPSRRWVSPPRGSPRDPETALRGHGLLHRHRLPRRRHDPQCPAHQRVGPVRRDAGWSGMLRAVAARPARAGGDEAVGPRRGRRRRARPRPRGRSRRRSPNPTCSPRISSSGSRCSSVSSSTRARGTGGTSGWSRRRCRSRASCSPRTFWVSWRSSRPARFFSRLPPRARCRS